MLFDAREISGSAAVIVVDDTVVDVPETVKLPDNVTLPENVCPDKASDLSSEDETAFAAISLAVTALAAISVAVTELPANWSAVTWSSSMCLVRIELEAIFALVTWFAAI